MWKDFEVPRRCLMLCPLRKIEEGIAKEPNLGKKEDLL